MNPVALYMASGDTLYVGGGMLIAVVAISPLMQRKGLQRARNLVFYLALIAMVIASPPFGWTTDCLFVILAVLWFVAWNDMAAKTWFRAATALGTTALALGLLVSEFSHRKAPVLSGVSDNHLVVMVIRYHRGLMSGRRRGLFTCMKSTASELRIWRWPVQLRRKP